MVGWPGRVVMLGKGIGWKGQQAGRQGRAALQRGAVPTGVVGALGVVFALAGVMVAAGR